MPIAYNSGTGILTITGYTEATPCSFCLDSYNADVSGGWGVVTRQCTNQFCFDCKVVIGDGSTETWVVDESKQMRWNAGIVTANNQNLLKVVPQGHLRLGRLLDDSDKTTGYGCDIHSAETTYNQLFGCDRTGSSNTDIQIFSTTFSGSGGWTAYFNIRFKGATGKIYNCLIRDGAALGTYGVNAYGIKVTVSDVGLSLPSGDVNNYDIFNVRGGFYFSIGVSATAKNCVVRDATYLAIASVNSSQYMINIDSDIWEFNWLGSYNSLIYRQYEFDLKLVDSTGIGIDSAKVKIWDKDDSLVTNTTTNASGVLATQILNYGYYYRVGGNTPTMKTPHEMRVYEYGKVMLSSKSSIESKTGWALTMLNDGHITQPTEGTVAAYTGITINHTAETITISENHTLDEIYDYCQYDIIAATKQIDQTMHTADGVNFVSEYSFVVNTGITVTATNQKLSMVSGETYTLTGTAQFTGIIATTTTTRIPIKLTNIINGSRYWVGKTSDLSKIFDGTQSGSGVVTGYYEHTADTPVTIRIRKSSTSPKYKPYETYTTLYAAVADVTISQVLDPTA